MPELVYDLLLTKPCEPGELASALAVAFGVPTADVDVAGEDTDDRVWTALVLATFAEVHGDVALSVSVTAVDGVTIRPTEAALASRLAELLHTPILYPAAEFTPSVCWLTDGPGRPARARLEPSDELDPSVEDELALTIDAVDRPVPSLPALRVVPIPEVIRAHRMPTPLRDSLVSQTDEAVGDSLDRAFSHLGAWEAFVARMAAAWPPDGWYPADYYAEDLDHRDDLDRLAKALAPDQATQISATLRPIDEAYDRLTVPDDGAALSAALGIPVSELAERASRWRRRPAELPWPV